MYLLFIIENNIWFDEIYDESIYFIIKSISKDDVNNLLKNLMDSSIKQNEDPMRMQRNEIIKLNNLETTLTLFKSRYSIKFSKELFYLFKLIYLPLLALAFCLF